MASDRSPPADITTAARFRRARPGLDGADESALPNVELLDIEPSPATVGLECSLNDLRQMVHANLKALAFFGRSAGRGARQDAGAVKRVGALLNPSGG